MSPIFIDNFLDPVEADFISSVVSGIKRGHMDRKLSLPYQISNSVSGTDEDNLPYWQSYGTCQLYNFHAPQHDFYKEITKNMLPKIMKEVNGRALIRVKCNYYPWTQEMKQHGWHTDYDYDNIGCLWSANTCDGFTEFKDGTKIDSVFNRLIVFDAASEHRSSTTTNAHGRFNINFNIV